MTERINTNLVERVETIFENKFGSVPELIVRSPGRINLLGEHIDLYGGIVLPAAIPQGIYIALGKREDEDVHVQALDFEDEDVFNISTESSTDKNWANYIRGVNYFSQEAGLELNGFNAVFCGDIPIGAGLSSSAALECGFGLGLNTLFHGNLDRVQIATIGQKAEHHYVGVKCGIMDQYASILGQENKLLRIDCHTLQHTTHDLPLGNYNLLLFNTGVEHTLASSAYNDRRSQCENGFKVLKSKYQNISHLGQVSEIQLDSVKNLLSKKAFQRCEYVIKEVKRTNEFLKAIKNFDLYRAGEIMYATHEGLSNAYEVSCKELDFLVDWTITNPDVLGARMMGGGFGGCTINLVKKRGAKEIIPAIQAAYKAEFGIDLNVYSVELSQGTEIVK